MNRRIALLSLLALTVAGCGAAGSAASPPKQPQTSQVVPVSASPAYTKSEVQSLDPGTSLGGKPAPGFTLTDQFGKSISLSQFRGKAVVLSFDDDECTTICPLTGQMLLKAKEALGSRSSDVVLLGINANPQHTAVSDVRTYSVQHGLLNHWFFLTAPPKPLESVWKKYHLEEQIVNGAIDHTPAVYVIGPGGGEQMLYLTSPDYGVVPLEAQLLAKEIAKTLPGHPKVKPIPQAMGGAITSPADKVSMPQLLGSGSVTLGGSAPRLVAFFDSWAPDVATNLTSLNTYAAAAKSGNLPPVTAVDVLPTEPSLTRAAALVKGLATPPAYPVAVDQTGRIADAYNTQDIPWFSLVSHGKVIWTHDGWLSASALQKDVKIAMSAKAPSASAGS